MPATLAFAKGYSLIFLLARLSGCLSEAEPMPQYGFPNYFPSQQFLSPYAINPHNAPSYSQSYMNWLLHQNNRYDSPFSSSNTRFPLRNFQYNWFPFRYFFVPQVPQVGVGVPLPDRESSPHFPSVFPIKSEEGWRIGSNQCSRDNYRGTCAYTSTKCQSRGGMVHQFCPNHSKMCCIFLEKECGAILQEEIVYLQNEQFSNSQYMSEPCEFTIKKMDSDFCILRVELEVSLPQSVDCSAASLEVIGSSQDPLQKLCGTISNTVYDIDIQSSSQVKLRFNFAYTNLASWKIKVTQKMCGVPIGTLWPSTSSGASSGVNKIKLKPTTAQTGKEPTPVTTNKKPSSSSTTTVAKKPASSAKTTPLSCGASRKFSGSKRPFLERSDGGYYEQLEKETTCVADACPEDRRHNPLLESDWWSVPTKSESVFYENAAPFNLVDERITFGKKTKQFDYPFLVAMFARGRFHCGASVISKKEILTAAHCVQRYKNNKNALKLSVGDYNVKSQTDGTNISPKIAEIIVHPGYSTRSLSNDIAIIRLAEPLTFNERVNRVCLPDSNLPLENELVTVIGWGRDENNLLQAILMEKTSAVVSNDVCNERWKKKFSSVNLIKGSMMCMDSQTGDSCKGDSGGPSVKECSKGSNNYCIVGVVSFGSTSCTDKKLPGVYTRVGSMLDWIKQHVTA